MRKNDKNKRPDDQHRNAINNSLSLAAAPLEHTNDPGVAHPLKKSGQDFPTKQNRQPIPFGRFANTTDDGFPFNRLRNEDRETAQDKQGGQRHDETWQSRAHNEVAIQGPKRDANDKCHKDCHPHRPSPS